MTDPLVETSHGALSDGLGDTLHDPLVQADTGDVAGGAGAIAARGVAGAGAPLPHFDRVQAAFGRHDVSGIQSATGGAAGDAAGAMGANAYATGSKVGFAKSPDLHTAAHEAAHVVQQRSGVQLKGGVGQAGDRYERHADAVADAVVAGRSAEGLLDAHPGAGGGTGVQRELKRSSVTKAALELEGPAFGIPGLKWAVKAEGEKESEGSIVRGDDPETTVKASLSGGLKYDLWFLEVGVDLTADIEIKVKGHKDVEEALHHGVKEFARWYAATRLGDVAGQRANLEGAFGNTRSEVNAAYQELRGFVRSGSFTDFKNGATSWFYTTKSPRAKVSSAIDGFHGQIQGLFSIAKADGDAIKAAKAFVDKNALLADFASAADTEPDKALNNIDRSQGRFLTRFDPAKGQLLSKFDGLDAAQMLKRDPDVQFMGTFGAGLSSKFSWSSDGGDNDSEVQVSASAGKRIQSGDEEDFNLGSQDVLRGKLSLKLGDWGAEFKGERQADDDDSGEQKRKWKLELEMKREGKLAESKVEEQLDFVAIGMENMAKSGLLEDTSAVPDVLDLLRAEVEGRAEGLQDVHKAEIGGEIVLGGEVEIEYGRANANVAWTRNKTAGKVSLAGMGGGKAGIDGGKLSKLGKVEGSVQTGVKLAKTFGG